MSFIAASPVPEAPGQTITSAAFWPTFDTATIREAMRLDGTVTEDRLVNAAISAIGNVNRDLATWRKEREAEGAATLADVEAEEINEVSELVHLYRRAVYATTRANLIERYRDFDATADGHQAADNLEPTVADLYRDARFAIRDILGIGHCTVELI